MSHDTVKPSEFPAWECPILTRFFGEHPVIGVNGDEWAECSDHPLSLVGACKIVASKIFPEDQRDAEINCPVCRKKLTLFMIHEPTLASEITRTERVKEERTEEEVCVHLKDGRELTVREGGSVKVNQEVDGSVVTEVVRKTFTYTKVEYAYTLTVPQSGRDPKVTELRKETKEFKTVGSIVLHPDKTYTYQEALKEWQTGSVEVVSHSTSETARPILAAVEGWEDQEYAPLMSKLIETFKQKNQLDMALARQIRDQVRDELGLPLGKAAETLTPNVKTLSPGRDLQVMNDDSCCLAKLGVFNVILLTAFTAATAIYAYTQGWFNNLARNITGSSDANMRHHNTMKVEEPQTPYNPGSSFGRGGPIGVYG